MPCGRRRRPARRRLVFSVVDDCPCAGPRVFQTGRRTHATPHDERHTFVQVRGLRQDQSSDDRPLRPPTNVSEQRETLRWVGAQTLMFVTKSSSTFGKGLAMIALREFMELAEKRQKEQREKAKKAL